MSTGRTPADPTPTSRPEVPVPCQNDQETKGTRGQPPGTSANPLTWARGTGR